MSFALGVLQSAAPPARRLLRCHPLTYAVAFLVGLALVLITVPGQQAPLRLDRLTWWGRQCLEVEEQTDEILYTAAEADPDIEHLLTELYEHGWPAPWLVRSTGAPSQSDDPYTVISTPWIRSEEKTDDHYGNWVYADYVSWSNYDNWPFSGVLWRIHPFNAAINLLVLLAGTAGAAIVCERWVRRGGVGRFRIVDLLIVVTVVGVALGWFAFHARMTDIEKQVIAYGADLPDGRRRIIVNTKYSGPDWLLKLVGDEDYLPWLHHGDDAIYNTRATWREDFEQIARLPRVEWVTFHLPIPAEAVQQLKPCSRLRWLSVRAPLRNEASITEYVERRRLCGEVEDAELLTPANLDGLTALGGVTEVGLFGRMFLAEDIERLLDNVPIERLHLSDPSITSSEMQAIKRKHPDVTISVSWPVGGPIRADDATAKRVREARRGRRIDWSAEGATSL